MGCFSGPKVESSQLVAVFDAANKKSYSQNEFQYSTDIVTFSGTSGANSTITRDTISSPVGNTPLKMVVTGNDPYVSSMYNTPSKNIALAANGQTWIASVYVKASVATTGAIFIFGAAADGNVFDAVTGQIAAGGVTIGTDWTRVWYTFTFTKGISFIQVRLDGPEPSGAGQTVWWDGLQVERVASGTTTPTPFTSVYYGGSVFKDLSGGGNTGALTYGPTYNSSNGGAIVFDGSDDCVVVNSNASVLSNTAYTKTVWFYVTSFATNNNLISGGNTGRHAFWLAGSNKLQAGHNSTWNTVSSATSLSLNTWYHAAVTFSTTTGWRLYLNGVLDSTNASTSTVFSAYDVADALFAEVPYGVGYGATTTFLGSGEILLGGYGTGSNGFSGRISNASVYNRVLSASEIQQNFNALRSRFGI
jgi:Concanavalin A-like lectin/glucanases superfamily